MLKRIRCLKNKKCENEERTIVMYKKLIVMLLPHTWSHRESNLSQGWPDVYNTLGPNVFFLFFLIFIAECSTLPGGKIQRNAYEQRRE